MPKEYEIGETQVTELIFYIADEKIYSCKVAHFCSDRL